MTNSNGVYFKQEDYASFSRRVFIALVDILVLCAASFAFAILIDALLTPTVATGNLILSGIALIVFGYLALLKRSKIRTLGYRLAGVRIVGFDGEIASLSSLCLRVAFLPLGPNNWVFDLIWSSAPHRQALRDKFAHTYVVKSGARPIGTGAILFNYYDVFCYNFLIQEVEVPTEQG